MSKTIFIFRICIPNNRGCVSNFKKVVSVLDMCYIYYLKRNHPAKQSDTMRYLKRERDLKSGIERGGVSNFFFVMTICGSIKNQMKNSTISFISYLMWFQWKHARVFSDSSCLQHYVRLSRFYWLFCKSIVFVFTTQKAPWISSKNSRYLGAKSCILTTHLKRGAYLHYKICQKMSVELWKSYIVCLFTSSSKANRPRWKEET